MRFTLSDQEQFARLSGDWNPIHVDPVFARRTMAGKAVVHGIHLLAWALDEAATRGFSGAPVAAIKASFASFVGVDEEVELRSQALDAAKVRLQIVAESRIKAEVTLTIGDPAPRKWLAIAPGLCFAPGREPLICSEESIEGMRGIVPSASPAEDWQRCFPRAAQWIGPTRLAALGASTRLVGMVSPGLHSLYLGLNLMLREDADGDGALNFEMGACRHGLIKAEVAGSGLQGSLECLLRPAPHAQPGMAELVGRVSPNAFAGHEVLIVGGSRGLGEVAAKLLAAGGAHVSISYASGLSDAERVAADIRSAGGGCDVLAYRLGDDVQGALDQLQSPPSYVYYFATPKIGGDGGGFFDRNRYAELQAFFVDGFWSLASAVRLRRADARIFYPSSVYVSERPKGFGEYAMAKAAGELLCAEINATMKPLSVIVERLPQLTTDQTLTSFGVRGGDPAETLLPILQRVQAEP